MAYEWVPVEFHIAPKVKMPGGSAPSHNISSDWTHADGRSKVQHAARLAAEDLGPVNLKLRRAKSPVQIIGQ